MTPLSNEKVTTTNNIFGNTNNNLNPCVSSSIQQKVLPVSIHRSNKTQANMPSPALL